MSNLSEYANIQRKYVTVDSETVALQDISNKYDDLLIATLVMASVALLFDVVALVVHNMCMCKLGCRANREGKSRNYKLQVRNN